MAVAFKIDECSKLETVNRTKEDFVVKRNTLLQECVAECIGVFIILFFGAGSVAALIFMKNYDSFWELSVMWGLAVMLAIYITGGVTGAHLNPAVTIGLAAFKGFPVKKIIPYIVSQAVGAFLGAAAVYGMYFRNFAVWEKAEGIVRGTAAGKADAAIFFTFPQDGLGYVQACVVELAITAMLMIVILAATDEYNPARPTPGMAAFIIGIAIAVIGGTFGGLTGFALNPARDFGPRIFAVLAGWGDTALPGPSGYFWVPIVGPILGGLTGGFVYQKLIHSVFVNREIEAETVGETRKKENLKKVFKEVN